MRSSERVSVSLLAQEGRDVVGLDAVALHRLHLLRCLLAAPYGRLLQAARKLADNTGKRLAEVISQASDGRLTLDGLKNLTDSDVALVSAATARME